MSFTSIAFFLFLGIVLCVYYLIPGNRQWLVLLIASYIFYLSAGVFAAVFLLFSTAVTWRGALAICRIREGSSGEPAGKAGALNTAAGKAGVGTASARKVLLAVLFLNLGVLAVLKYTNFVLGNINFLFHLDIPLMRVWLPLGISYYTFMAIGYLLDVYWGRVQAEESFWKAALFLSFFPHIVQGPIGRYGKLGPQFDAPHPFRFRCLRSGAIRIVWGMFKMMLAAGWAGVYRAAIFANPDAYAGINIFGVLLYSVELYGNFSGGIDIAIGVAELFGITLDENFRQPYFAVSVSDFWRRWHMSLGGWMKDYVLYPLTLSRWMNRFGKTCKKAFGRKKGRLIPICLSSIIVFFLVGLWHGASWGFIGWGLYNGILIAISNLLTDQYASWKKRLQIRDNSFGWRIFMMARTFALMNLSWYFDCVRTPGEALHMIRNSLTHFSPAQFLLISSGKTGTAYTPTALAILCVCVLVIFCVSVLQERGLKIRETMSAWPMSAQYGLCFLLLLCTLCLSPMASGGGFIYAQF